MRFFHRAMAFLRRALGLLRRGFVWTWRLISRSIRWIFSKIDPDGAKMDAGVEAGISWLNWRRISFVIVSGLFLYYFIGFLLVYNIDDDPNFSFDQNTLLDGQARSVAIASAVVRREIDENGWVSNSPFFVPSRLNENMRHYQQGIVQAVAIFSVEMRDRLGRARGSSQADPNLSVAAGEIQFAPDIWYWNPSQSLLPHETTESHYRRAMDELDTYNMRLAQGATYYERRADNLFALLDRLAVDLGSSSGEIDEHLRRTRLTIVDFESDDIFYMTKGRVYAYYLILRELRIDFSEVIEEREVAVLYDQMLDSMRAIVGLNPQVVINGKPDSQFFASHLASEGFLLLRARTQLREITSSLRVQS